MSTFVFGIDPDGVLSQLDRATVAGSAARVEGSLYRNTPNEELIYKGDDPLIWDRINSERLRRGLPPLNFLGYPRPPEEPGSDTGGGVAPPDAPEVFKIKGPPGMTLDQARAILDQQNKTGSLTGFSVGDSLSAVSQAAAGLPSAQALLNQSLAQAQARLPPGADLATITSTLGPRAAAAGAQISTNLTGQLAALATNVQGQAADATGVLRNLPGRLAGESGAITGSVSAAISAVQQGAPAVAQFANRIVPGLGSGVAGVTGAIVQSGASLGGLLTSAPGLATDALRGLERAQGLPVTDPINVANLVKQGTASVVAGLGSIDVTAALSQAARLVGQPHRVISDTAGVGKFGLDLGQLERSGHVKPGTAASLGTAAASITSVLKSPTVFTGKDGVKNLDGLLNNEGLQTRIQTNLMTSGLADLKGVGVPVDKFTPQAVAGLANNAAKSVSKTVDSLRGLAPPDVQSAFDTMARDSAYAVTFAQTKVDKLVLGQVTAEPAVNTVDAATIQAAATRVLGNDKIPNPNIAPRIERSLYADTPDQDLVYRGNDPMVWDRINAERIRRGLPGLAAIGIPRPPDEDPAQSPTIFT